MNWFLYGHETWLVAVLKGVPLFLFIYFLMTYVPNYVYYLITVELPFLRLSDDLGFLIANGVAGGNFALIVILAIGVQAARGRRGVGWSAHPHLRRPQLPDGRAAAHPAARLQPGRRLVLAGDASRSLSVAFGMVVAGLGAAACVYLYFEYKRITRRDAEEAARLGRGGPPAIR